MNFTEKEQIAVDITRDNINYFNRNKRKGKLRVEYFVDDGNRAALYKDDTRILGFADIEQASAAVVAIINYERKECYDSV